MEMLQVFLSMKFVDIYDSITINRKKQSYFCRAWQSDFPLELAIVLFDMLANKMKFNCNKSADFSQNLLNSIKLHSSWMLTRELENPNNVIPHSKIVKKQENAELFKLKLEHFCAINQHGFSYFAKNQLFDSILANADEFYQKPHGD